METDTWGLAWLTQLFLRAQESGAMPSYAAGDLARQYDDAYLDALLEGVEE